MASLCLPLSLLLLDTSITYIYGHLVYKYPLFELLSAIWLLSLIKVPVLASVVLRLPCPSWIPSPILYVLTLSLAPPLYQTLRFLLESQPPELPSGLSNSLFFHLPLLLACLLWDLALPLILPKQTPGEDENGRNDQEYFKRILRYSKPDALYMLGAFVCLTLALIGEMFIPYYTGRIIDILNTHYKASEFLDAIFYVALFSLASSVFTGGRGGFFMYCMSSLTQRIRELLYRALMRQDINFFDITKTGEITSRINNDAALVSRSIALNVNVLLRTLVKCVGVYSFMFSISWKLTILTFVSTPLTGIVQKYYNKYHQDLVQKVQDSIAKSSDLAKEIIESVKTVRSFATEEEEAKRYEDALQKTHKLETIRDLIRIVYGLLIRLINLGSQVSMLFYGQHLIQSGYISSGKMVAFIMYQMESGDHVRTLVHMISQITHSASVAKKVFQYLDRVPEVSTSGSLCPEGLHGHFEFRNVTFSYPSRPDTPALQDVSFTLTPGTVTAVVGPSGGGKTTCVSLLERFYEPQFGDILLDGRPLREYEHHYLHQKVALVAQEPVLFTGSVRDNIRYGLQNLSESHLKVAARQAQADVFIQGLESGYNTDVGESGSQLGAGQKQRIALARALARKPKLLILDEASSCLDAETEHQIQQSLQNIQGLSLLVVAHRLRTIQKADQILVLEGGDLVERGTHEELIQKQGVYNRLLNGHVFQNGA
ncbi:antigen peptide transporter 2 [Bombina bombina]|uniref:antigen peptide transporter 2 n=1 Tax=Bombina bombina TaxID=8345 RepID=UPI00235AB1BC|nr:antigen peptide transporter 2 [Bombina bombina]